MDFPPIRVGVIPTTAGTGSECNGAAVITNEKTKVKIGYDYAKCNPVFALMDPVYTYSVPEKQMVSGAFDSLSHIMETYFSEPDEQNVSDEIGEAQRNQKYAAGGAESGGLYGKEQSDVDINIVRKPADQAGEKRRLRMSSDRASAGRIYGLQSRTGNGRSSAGLLRAHL